MQLRLTAYLNCDDVELFWRATVAGVNHAPVPQALDHVARHAKALLDLECGEELRAFLGPRPHAETLRLIRDAALLVLPSRVSEGCPNVLLESLACGVPVVSTNVGGVPEIIRSGVDGLLAPYGDLPALQTALLSALERRWDREALVCRAREFDWADAVEQALEELQHALKGDR
jgi:glycosyltransferase involved in cell wall biosynthesis